MSLDQLYRGIAEIPGIENFTASFIISGSELDNSGSIYSNYRTLTTSSGYVTQKFSFPTASFGTASLGTASFSIQSNTISKQSASLFAQPFYTSSESELVTATNFHNIRFKEAEYYGRPYETIKFHSPIEITSSLSASGTGLLTVGGSGSEGERVFTIKDREGNDRIYYNDQQRLQLGSNEATVSIHGLSVQITGSTTSNSALTISSNQINFTNLPTSDPGVAGRLYRDGGTVKVSI